MKADKWSSNQTSNSVEYLVIRNVSKSLNYLVPYISGPYGYDLSCNKCTVRMSCFDTF